MGVDTTEVEKKLRGVDDDTIGELLQEYKDEKKGHWFQPVQKFDVEKLNLGIIAEQIEPEQLSEGNERFESGNVSPASVRSPRGAAGIGK